MQKLARNSSVVAIATLALACGFTGLFNRVGFAQNNPHRVDALSGRVSSADEGPMEGVLVTAKKEDSTIAITVISDAQGRYRFPSAKLDAGHYLIKIRAAGYDLDSPNAIDVYANGSTADIKLRKTTNLAAQLTNAEWLASMTGTNEQKAALRYCTTCHTLMRPIGSPHDADEFVAVQQRMATYTNQSTPLMPQPRLAPRLADQNQQLGEEQLDQRKEAVEKQATFLASVNLGSRDTWPYPLKTFARPSGAATRAVITEYDLPARTRQPHDVVLGADGMIWYISFGEQILGRLDPKTGKVNEYPIPTLKPNSPKGELALRPDEDGNLWIGMMYQGAVARFDRASEKFQTWSLPPNENNDYTQVTEVNPTHAKVDGKVWLMNAGTYTIYRLDPVSGKIEKFKPFPDPSPNVYDISPDAQNNLYFTVFGKDQIGRVDAKTGEITFYRTPTKDSNPRRGSVDAQGRFWFGEFGGNRVGMFDTKTLAFKEWVPPTPWTFPYDAIADKNGEVWAGSTTTDRVMRLNPETGKFIEYLMPRDTNMRRVAVDNRTSPVTFWVGNDHGASIIKLETKLETID